MNWLFFGLGLPGPLLKNKGKFHANFTVLGGGGARDPTSENSRPPPKPAKGTGAASFRLPVPLVLGVDALPLPALLVEISSFAMQDWEEKSGSNPFWWVPLVQQTRVYPHPLVAGSARPNPKMGAPDPETPLFLGLSVLRWGLRPWSRTMVSEGARPWGMG